MHLYCFLLRQTRTWEIAAWTKTKQRTSIICSAFDPHNRVQAGEREMLARGRRATEFQHKLKHTLMHRIQIRSDTSAICSQEWKWLSWDWWIPYRKCTLKCIMKKNDCMKITISSDGTVQLLAEGTLQEFLEEREVWREGIMVPCSVSFFPLFKWQWPFPSSTNEAQTC